MSPLRKRLAALATRASSAPRLAKFEFRRWRLARRYLRGSGLEIGALHCPLRVPSGVSVRYVDRMDVAALHRHYPELPVKKLVPVDLIDDGEKLDSQADASADFIIANHFIEHTEDPLGALASHLRVIRPGGILYLAVPDRRHTFDAARPPTDIEHVVADHVEGPERSRRAHLKEWAQLVEQVAPAEVPARVHALQETNYSIHFHVWTTEEFTALLDHARLKDKLPFTVEALEPNGHEFIAILRRASTKPRGARSQMSAAPPGGARATREA
jgi:predicted SAM-dependent methyltransferase